MDSFVEETVFSSRSGDEGGENGDEDGGLQRPEVTKEEDKVCAPLETKKKLLEECFQSD